MASEPERFDIDPALLQDFLVESRESLEGLGALFVQLESRPGDLDLVDRIFRPVHSIKGNSSFFGLAHIKTFSHTLENLLQDLRSRTLQVTKPVIDALLRGVDMLTGMVERLAAGEKGTALGPEEEALVAEVGRLRTSGAQDASALLASALAAIDRLAASAPAGTEADLEAVRGALRELVRQLAPETAGAAADQGAIRYLLGGEDVTGTVRSLHDFVHALATEPAPAAEPFLDALGRLEALAAGRSNLRERLGALRGDFTAIHESGIGFDELLAGLIHEKFEAVRNALEREGASAVPAAAAPAKNGDGEAAAKSAGEEALGKTIRVAEEKVDGFMRYVGELIITSEVFAYIQKKLEGVEGVRDVAVEFKKAILDFNELSLNLQRSLMEVRRVPLKTVLQKLPRTVRDLAHGLGKEVELSMEGQMVQIDKSLIEALEAPITHMVRNCVDHAIETPDERRLEGKNPAGRITIHAEADEETFTLRIADDGRGLDVAAIKTKAVEKGSVTAAQAEAMTDQEAFRLIFGAGVSTARQVTDVSGRGVGMDVVRTNIEGQNGTIEIDSVPGKGTTFTITMPMTVTLLVVDGLLAQVAETTYIIPLAQVSESLRPHREDVTMIAGQGEVVNVRGRLYPLVRLHRLFGVESRAREAWEGVVVLAETETRSGALLVDNLVGQQSVVLKELADYFASLAIIRGGAILGSGRVGLVLDVEAILGQSASTARI